MAADKLWIELYGRAVWRWGLDALLGLPGMGVVAVVAPADGLGRFRGALPAAARDRCLVVAGGEARADSVRAGLAALTDGGVSADTVVLVHDAARPAASTALMERVVAAVAGDAAIPVLPVADTLKRVTDGRADQTVDREGLGAAQTPQAASLGILVAALDAARARGWDPTDEAAAVAAIGVPVHAVAGDPANHQLTDWTDIDVWRRAPLRVAPMDELTGMTDVRGRVGIGVDAHRPGALADAPRWPRLLRRPAGLAGT
jgi:2-C-methyl-D-erythritol 4-phosphate cytidylyltransferase